MEKITVQQAKALIDNSVGTIYSKNDVLAILDRIENHTTSIVPNTYEGLASKIAREIVSSINNVECIDGWDLSINYNEVSVDSLEANEDDIEEMVEKVLNNWFGDDDDCGC